MRGVESGVVHRGAYRVAARAGLGVVPTILDDPSSRRFRRFEPRSKDEANGDRAFPGVGFGNWMRFARTRPRPAERAPGCGSRRVSFSPQACLASAPSILHPRPCGQSVPWSRG